MGSILYDEGFENIIKFPLLQTIIILCDNWSCRRMPSDGGDSNSDSNLIPRNNLVVLMMAIMGLLTLSVDGIN